MSREPLTSVDTAWYRLDEPLDPVDITVLFVFDEPVDYERLKKTLEARLLRYERFKQRVVESPMGVTSPHWETDEHFDIDAHVHRVALPQPKDKAALQELVGDLMSHQLDMSRPLWEMHLVEDYGEGSALVIRLHHCIGDGFALVRVMLTLADKDPDAPIELDVDEEVGVELEVDVQHSSFMHDLGDLIRHPEKAVEAAELSAKAAASLGHILMLPFDPDTCLKGDLVGVRHAAWSDGMSLQRVKDVAHAYDAKVNDVLLGAMTGALRRFLQSAGEDVDNLSIRALVPVNLRPVSSVEEMEPTLGNRFGLVYLTLPVYAEDARERMDDLKTDMDRLKGSPEAVVAFGVLNALGYGPRNVEHLLQDVFGKKASVVATNVPGPKDKLYFAGKELKSVMFWVPHPAKLGVGISILSYAGEVRIGVRADRAICEQPSDIVEAFEEEFEALAASVEGD